MSMLGSKDNETRSYLEIVDALRQHGAAPKQDMQALWRRLVFNILISNTDDHLRNHGFLYEGPDGWRLSPAYDLNPVPTDIKPRILSTAINEDDNTASLALAMEVAGYFELDADKAFFKRMEAIRIKAGAMMGLGDVSKSVVPKVSLIARPRHGGTISSRFFVPYACHKAHPVTGTVCLASACAIPGTIAEKIAGRSQAPQGILEIEHPSGRIAIDFDADFTNGKQELRRAALIRTARRIFEGSVNVPKAVWAGK